MTDLVTFAFVAQTATLVITSLLVAYPLVAYGHNVAHTVGVACLAGTLAATTASYVAFSVFGMGLVSAALDLTAALSLAAAMWSFARPFVRTGDPELERPTADATGEGTAGGFERADD